MRDLILMKYTMSRIEARNTHITNNNDLLVLAEETQDVIMGLKRRQTGTAALHSEKQEKTQKKIRTFKQ